MAQELLEGAQATQEPTELAIPQVSEVTEVQQPSVGGGVSEARLTELLEAQRTALLEDFDRKLQSQKDRRIGKLEGKVDELLATKAAVEAAGGWDQVIRQQQYAEDLKTELNAALDARLSQTPASQPDWRAEWDAESRKITDAASKLGITLSTEEYNAALFGKKFATRGDAYAALNQAVIAKAKGEAIPRAAVATEGGEVARPPEPRVPKTFRQKFDEARTSGNDKEARKLLDEQWKEVEKLGRIEAARQTLAAAGVTPEELTK